MAVAKNTAKLVRITPMYKKFSNEFIVSNNDSYNISSGDILNQYYGSLSHRYYNTNISSNEVKI